MEEAPEFTKDLPGTPLPPLTYSVSSSIPCNSDAATMEIKVSDKTENELRLKVLDIEFNVGDSAGDLFKQPNIKDGEITANPIARAISPRKRFKFAGSDTPSTADDALLFRATCTEEKVQALGETLTITFTGVTSAAAGEANITISEVVEDRGDDVPVTDPELSFSVTKKGA